MKKLLLLVLVFGFLLAGCSGDDGYSEMGTEAPENSVPAAEVNISFQPDEEADDSPTDVESDDSASMEVPAMDSDTEEMVVESADSSDDVSDSVDETEAPAIVEN